MTPEDFKKIDNYIKDTWYKNHRAHYTLWPKQEMEVVIWKNPENSSYLINYILAGGYLHVTGDVGNAIYNSGLNSLKEWSKCDLGYFESKCVASEKGDHYKEWDADFLKKRVQEELERSDTGVTWEKLSEAGALDSMCFKNEWIVWLACHGQKFFGSDPSCWPTDGERTAVRCKGHLIGLRMVVEQLTNENILK